MLFLPIFTPLILLKKDFYINCHKVQEATVTSQNFFGEIIIPKRFTRKRLKEAYGKGLVTLSL